MKLITVELERQLLKNGVDAAAGHNTAHYPPVLKLFTPWANATWLITERDPEDPDLLFGLCDLGVGEPELGYVRLSELMALRGPAGLKVERDRWFQPHLSIAEYATLARAERRIST